VLDVNIAKNILSNVKDKKIMDYFFSEEYQPITNSNNERIKFNKKIIEIDAKGMFTRILLSELNDFAQRIYGMEPRPYMLGEIESLMEFLYKIANKQYQVDVPLTLELAHIRVALVLVADTHKILEQGVEPYLKAIIHKATKEIYSIYLLVWNKDNLGVYNQEAAEEFKKAVSDLDMQILQKTELQKVFEEYYKIIDNFGQKRTARISKYIIKNIE
jgi:hypothetical protein